MSVIENFAELSAKEQLDFATALVKTINSESIFTDQTNLKVSDVEADDMTGGLIITLDLEDALEVKRKASWACLEAEDADNKPEGNIDFINSKVEDDIKDTFKALYTELEGYSVTLSVNDADTEEIIDVEVDAVTEEDSGVGHYDYFGFDGYDSRPYFTVEGILTQACTAYCSLYVEADTHFETEPVEEN